jgi:tetratricopeptide (TPR) repeat protein
MKRSALALWLALSTSACGGGSPKAVAAPALAPASPQAVEKLVAAVRAAQDKGGDQRAIGLLDEALKSDPQLWEARYNRGILLARRGELAAADEELSRAFELAPNAEDVAVALAEVRRRRGQPARAAEVLEAFVGKQPDAVVARIALVGALRESGKVERAIAHAREVLVRRPNDPQALAELALSHLEVDQVDTAELINQEALKAQTKSAAAERTAGLIALSRGDDAVAFQHFARATELDAKDTTARLNMATVLLQAGIYERAQQEFRTVLAVNPDDVAATLGLAAAVRGTGGRDKAPAYQEARRLLEQLLEREPNNAAATFNLAILYADFLQQSDKAKPLFERFLKLAPENHPARALATKRLSGQGQVTQKGAPAAKSEPLPKKK